MVNSAGTRSLVTAFAVCASFVWSCGGATSGVHDPGMAHATVQDASANGEGDALVVTNEDGGIFLCGSALTCDGRSQVCEHVQGGPPPGVDFYECIPIPAACDSEVSCACVTAALRGRGAGACSAAGNHLTVQIDVP